MPVHLELDVLVKYVQVFLFALVLAVTSSTQSVEGGQKNPSQGSSTNQRESLSLQEQLARLNVPFQRKRL